MDNSFVSKVGVVIPCFNHGQYIDKAISSIREQTFSDHEILVIDDGSTDRFTISKLKEFESGGIRIINQKNSGTVNARNVGINMLKNPYILPLDADDYFEKTFLEKAVRMLDENAEMGLVSSYIRLFGDLDFTVKPEGGGVENFLLKPNACGSSLFRRICWEQAKGYNSNMAHGYEDWDFWLNITKRGWTAGIIPEELFYYRRILSKSRDVKADKIRPVLVKQIIENHIDLYRDNILYYAYSKELEIEQLKINCQQAITNIYRSLPYRVGKNILRPDKVLMRFFAKFKNE